MSSDHLPSSAPHPCSGQISKGQEDFLFFGGGERLAKLLPLKDRA